MMKKVNITFFRFCAVVDVPPAPLFSPLLSFKAPAGLNYTQTANRREREEYDRQAA